MHASSGVPVTPNQPNRHPHLRSAGPERGRVTGRRPPWLGWAASDILQPKEGWAGHKTGLTTRSYLQTDRSTTRPRDAQTKTRPHHRLIATSSIAITVKTCYRSPR